jgi:hypothetical protein
MLPVALELAGAACVLGAVAVLVSGWLAVGIGGAGLVGLGFLLEYRLEARE